MAMPGFFMNKARIEAVARTNSRKFDSRSDQRVFALSTEREVLQMMTQPR